jgi:hypothetical protein
MSDANTHQFPVHFSDPVMQRILNIPLPPPDNIAQEYGFGFGEDFDIDYELITEAHSFEPPNNLQLPPPGPVPHVSDNAIGTVNNTYLPLPPAEHTAAATNNANTITTTTPPTTPAAQPGRGKGRRSKFSPTELEELARVVYSTNPYGAKHGDKKTAWEDVAKKLKDKGLFMTSSVDTIRNKMASLLTYFEVSFSFNPLAETNGLC